MNQLRLFLVFATLAFAGPVAAALSLQLAPANVASAPGGVMVFQGMLTNTSATDKLFLNNIDATLVGTAATKVVLKSNAFYANVPGILLPGESYNGPLFQMKLEASSLDGDYSGTILLQGGADIFATGTLTSNSFTLLATPVEQWRYNTFGSPASDGVAAADDGDWDHDGVFNLLEYALGMAPKAEDRSSLPQPVMLNNYLAISYVPAVSTVSYLVESSTNLIDWSSTDVEAVTIANPSPPGSLTFRYKQPLSTSHHVFLRIKVTR